MVKRQKLESIAECEKEKGHASQSISMIMAEVQPGCSSGKQYKTTAKARPNWKVTKSKPNLSSTEETDSRDSSSDNEDSKNSRVNLEIPSQDKTTVAKAKRGVVDIYSTENDSPRTKKLKEEIILLRKKSQESEIKIKCLQNKIRRVMRKQRKRNEKNGTLTKEERSLKLRSSSTAEDSTDTGGSKESFPPSPSSSPVQRINFDSEILPTKYEQEVEGDADFSTRFEDDKIGLNEDIIMIETVKTEQENDPLMFTGSIS